MTELETLVGALCGLAGVYILFEVFCAVRRVNRDRRNGR